MPKNKPTNIPASPIVQLNDPLFSQFRNLLYDKLIVCKKEIKHLNTVICFFESHRSTDNNKDNAQYSIQFKYILDNLKILDNAINQQSKEIYRLFQQSHHPAVLLTHIGRHEYHIYQFIRKIGLLQRKVAQVNEDIFEQYVPKPALQRRHSNKVLGDFMNNYFSHIFKKFTTENSNTQDPIFVWGHRDKFRVYNTLFGDNANNNEYGHSIIESAFWYYEIPRLIPALAHEVGHLLRNTDNFKTFHHNINKDTPNATSLLQQQYHGASTLAEEFFGDFIAYLELGDAYLVTLFYTLLPYRFYEIFYDNQNNSIAFEIPDVNDDEWRHLAIILARIKVLLELHTKNNQTNETIAKTVQTIKSFIGNTLEGKKDFGHMGYSYQAHDTLKDAFDKFINLTDEIYTIFYPCLAAKPTINNTIRNAIHYKKIFEDIWQQHLNEKEYWQHPKLLRENILYQTFNSNKEVNTFPAFELTFVKQRTDTEDKQTSEMSNMIQKDIFYDTDNQNSVKLNTFGIFNQAYILPKKEKISYSDIYKSFLDTSTNSSSENTTKGYYLYKIPIVFVGSVTPSPHQNNEKGNFTLLLQLMMKPTESAHPERINEAKEIILNCLNGISCNIYKTLGPSDFLIHIPDLTLDKLYEIKELFWKNNKFKRTYSVIGYSNNFNETKNNNYSVYSKIRLKESISKDSLLSCNEAISASITTGVTDLEIRWKKIISPRKAQDILSDHKLTFSDIQTFIAKNININNDNN